MSSTMTTAISVAEKVCQSPSETASLSEVDHHQDGAAIDRCEDLLTGADPLADPGLQQLAGYERNEQQQDLLQQIQREAAVGGGHRQADEQRREEHAEKARCRGGADGCRNIARHGSKGNRRLDGGGQQAEEEYAPIERGIEQALGNETGGKTEQWKQHEGGAEDRQMQPPVQQAHKHDVNGKAGAMQEEEKADRNVWYDAEIVRRLAADRQNGCKQHRADKHDGKAVGQKALHFLFLYLTLAKWALLMGYPEAGYKH